MAFNEVSASPSPTENPAPEPFLSPSITRLTAHSGCDGTKDNSLDFVRYALALGIDCLEADIWMDSRGELVLSHDEPTPADEDRNITTLSEAFALLAASPGIRMNCDLKAFGLEWPVWQAAAACGVADRLVYSGTVSPEAFKLHPEMRSGVSWFYNLELAFPELRPTSRDLNDSAYAGKVVQELRSILNDTGACCLNLSVQFRTTPLWVALREAGIPLSVWTPDDPAVIRALLSEGTAAITTRNAAQALAIWKISFHQDEKTSHFQANHSPN